MFSTFMLLLKMENPFKLYQTPNCIILIFQWVLIHYGKCICLT